MLVPRGGGKTSKGREDVGGGTKPLSEPRKGGIKSGDLSRVAGCQLGIHEQKEGCSREQIDDYSWKEQSDAQTRKGDFHGIGDIEGGGAERTGEKKNIKGKQKKLKVLAPKDSPKQGKEGEYCV